MNQKSEQITAAYNILVDDDQPLSLAKLRTVVADCLGAGCAVQTLYGRKSLVYQCPAGKLGLTTANVY